MDVGPAGLRSDNGTSLRDGINSSNQGALTNADSAERRQDSARWMHVAHRPDAGREETASRSQLLGQSLAHAKCQGQLQQNRSVADIWRRTGNGGQQMADADGSGLQGHGRPCERPDEWTAWAAREPLEGIWLAEPDVGRVAYGVPCRVDRLKGLGNAIVPQVAYIFLKAIADHLNAVEAT